ncbi:MAG: ATP-binding cassette domain-containing protein [Bacteroidales bacterium]|nr:ATP-binding cassette domain-containing protein [Bacteroidales bacterium]
MSEEILKALIQLFALTAKQDGGIEDKELQYVESFLVQQLGAESSQSWLLDFKKQVGLILTDEERAKKEKQEAKIKKLQEAAANDPEAAEKLKALGEQTSVKESVRVLGICKKINKTINQQQKIVVYVRLFELLNTSKKFTTQRKAIIQTVGEVFNINPEASELQNGAQNVLLDSENFVTNDDTQKFDSPNLLVISDNEYDFANTKSIRCEGLDSDIFILRVTTQELYFMRYTGSHEVFLNGQAIFADRIYSFAPGATLKLSKGKPVYYSDVVATFQADKTFTNLSFNVNNLEFKFPNGAIGLRNINFSECQGRLVGIMGASGAGKTTLLNVLSGITSPSQGSVLINGVNLHTQSENLEGVIGLIPQDDLLIEELTVFENLYFSAKFCFKDLTDDEIKEKVNTVLKSLGLYERRNLKVGNSLNKLISGGQRKRLNIALELIREPSILFVDEPTSGLSSRDSENVMDLLRELTLKGKLIFVVIHQPSSQIYKMFDKMIILDTGGYLVYYGHPIDCISYFKTADNQVKSEEGECPVCGNSTPEVIFDIIEAQTVDEFGRFQDKRKVDPPAWEKRFHENVTPEKIDDVTNEPPKNLNVPNWFNQFKIYLTRDFKSKVSNLQYIVLNLTEAPLLGFILSFLIRYTSPTRDQYVFFENENIVPYLFMSIIVALFLGLTVSAEEIFRDRKILKREEFLNLSRSSYLVAKVVILTCISAIQAFLYVLVGNSILQICDMYLSSWLVLFPMFVFANMLGLNISSAFNSAVTIYILIPLLMIPQMALGGSMFSFNKLNQIIGSVGRVPIIAEIMPSRWAYEALMVKQYRDNKYEQEYFEFDKELNYCNQKQSNYVKYLLDARSMAKACVDSLEDDEDEIEAADIERIQKTEEYHLALLREEIASEMKGVPEIEFDYMESLTVEKYDEDIDDEVRDYLEKLKMYYIGRENSARSEIDGRKTYYNKQRKNYVNDRRDKYYNEKLMEIVRNNYEQKKIIRYGNRLIIQAEPIYFDADSSNFFGFRSHFYAPRKWFCGKHYDTFSFNIIVIWLFSVICYVTLYFNLLKRLVDWLGNINFSAIISNIGKKFAKKPAEQLPENASGEAKSDDKKDDKTPEKQKDEK